MAKNMTPGAIKDSYVSANEDDILTAAEMLTKPGGVIVMPTETVYGLAGNATDGEAIRRIYTLKARPPHNPLIIHCATIEDAARFAYIGDKAQRLLRRFSPGPLTVVLRQKPHSPMAPIAVAGLATVAVRIPAHPFAQALLRRLPFPIAAPSANRSGRLSPTQAQHCRDFAQSLAPNFELPIFDGGACTIGLESTIIDASHENEELTLLRPGAVSGEAIFAALKLTIESPINSKINSQINSKINSQINSQINSPGQLAWHYAPNLPLVKDVTVPLAEDAYIAFGATEHAYFLNLSPTADLTEAAHNLFAYLHAADKSGKKRIAVAPIPNSELGIAINERLAKAAQKNQ